MGRRKITHCFSARNSTMFSFHRDLKCALCGRVISSALDGVTVKPRLAAVNRNEFLWVTLSNWWTAINHSSAHDFGICVPRICTMWLMYANVIHTIEKLQYTYAFPQCNIVNCMNFIVHSNWQQLSQITHNIALYREQTEWYRFFSNSMHMYFIDHRQSSE